MRSKLYTIVSEPDVPLSPPFDLSCFFLLLLAFYLVDLPHLGLYIFTFGVS